jgi:nucleotide-binding universal stress UspA family protein
MIQKILAAYDGSESAEKAFALALDLAAKYGAELYVLAVSRPPEFGTEVEAEAIIENSRQHYQKILKPLHAKTEAAKVWAHFETAVGHPAEQIIYHAENSGADLIVMGHRGQTLFERLLVGSVARQVIAHAHCAVLVAR